MSPVVFAALLPHAPVLIPSVSRGRAQRVRSTLSAVREVARRLAATRADTLIVISPHSPRKSEMLGIWSTERLRGTLASFGASEEGVDFQNDAALAEQIAYQADRRGVRTTAIRDSALDHGAIVPLWFAAEAGWDRPAAVTGLSDNEHFKTVEFGAAIAEAAAKDGRHLAIIASGDMSHRLTPEAPCGFDERGARFDEWLMGTLRRGRCHELLDFDADLTEAAAEDALDSILIALGATDFKASGSEVLSYEGPFGVGYGVAVLYSEVFEEPCPMR
jgi:aromatic ring-opening dioxygenase LigB subunit